MHFEAFNLYTHAISTSRKLETSLGSLHLFAPYPLSHASNSTYPELQSHLLKEALGRSRSVQCHQTACQVNEAMVLL